jgi:glycosyltransferase involved in cell wall biosynthesis
MKIAHITCVYPPEKSGMSHAARHFAVLNSEAGHAVTVFTPRYQRLKDALPRERNGDVQIERLKPLFEYGNGAFIPSIFKRLKSFDAAFLHYPFFGGAETVLAAHLVNRIQRLYLHYHMAVPEMNKIQKFLSLPSTMAEKFLFKRASAISCASMDYLKSSPANRYFINMPEKFFEIPFGVDVEIFKPNESKHKNTVIKILFVGRLDRAHHFKGLDILFKALKKLAEKKFNFSLEIVGEGDMAEYYKSLAESAGIIDSICWRDRVGNDKLPQAYRESDIFVLPSTGGNEAFGMVLLEAMASGVPVVASRLPGVSSVFTDGLEGFYAEPGSADDLAEKFERLFADSALRKKMGEAGRATALKKYTWEGVGEKLENMMK